jgi:hypothetical protein
MAFDFKKIKGLFIREVDDPEASKKKEEKAPDPKSDKDILELLKNKDKAPVADGGPVVVQGQADGKILDSLIKALEDNNLPGEDYMEYAEALQSMEKIPLEESVKIQTVLATLSTRGLTKEKIVESGTYYISVLEKEKQKFGKAMEKQMKEGVMTKQQEIDALEELNKTKSQQIAALTQEIKDNQAEVEKIKAKIAENEVKIKGTEANFLTTYNFVVQQLQANIDKINALLPPKGK